MKKNNKVSIIMSTYNDELFIDEAITSIIKQSHTNWELIIINDASTDDAEKIILKYANKDKRIRYIKNKLNLGVAKNLNKGLQLAEGGFAAQLDGDDIWLDLNKLQLQLQYLLNNPQISMVGTWGHMIYSNGGVAKKLQYPIDHKKIKNYLLIENCFIHSSVMYRKEHILNIGGYDEAFELALDYELWLRLARNKKVHNLPKYMVGYRINESGITSRKHNKQIADTILAIKANKDYYPFFLLSLILWYLRKFLPRSFRAKISKKARQILFFR